MRADSTLPDRCLGAGSTACDCTALLPSGSLYVLRVGGAASVQKFIIVQD